jgi:hypothetical protein
MTLSDLADNVQAKTKTSTPFGAPLERFKDLGQSVPLDDWSVVAYLDANVSLLAQQSDAHRLVRHAVMDCIYHEIPKQLPQPSPVPGTLAVAHDLQLQPAVRICSTQLL